MDVWMENILALIQYGSKCRLNHVPFPETRTKELFRCVTYVSPAPKEKPEAFPKLRNTVDSRRFAIVSRISETGGCSRRRE